MIPVKKPKVALFDWDSTLVKSCNVWEYVMFSLSRDFNLAPGFWENDTVRQNRYLSLRDSFPKIFGNMWYDMWAAVNRYMSSAHLKELALMPYATELLETMAKDGVAMYIMSNKGGPFVRREAKYLKVEKFFRKIIGSCDVEYDKPDPRMVYQSLRDDNIDERFIANNAVWFVGDSQVDVECGYKAKCHPILVKCPTTDYSNLHNKNLKFTTVDGMAQLLDLYHKA